MNEFNTLLIDYEYIVAILIFLVFQISRVILRKIVFYFAEKFTNRSKTKVDDRILEALKKPVDFLFILLGLHFAMAYVHLPNGIESFMNSVIRSGFAISIFWGLLNIITPLSHIVYKFTEKFGQELSDDIAKFLIKAIRFVIVLIAVATVFQEWGYNISGFLASLGLVGMALALAAKDTAANLFGSLVIFTDRPFKVGDWVKTPDVEGIIEDIGIRSTRVRTFAQALVTVPNATLANSAILNWSKMGKRRIKMNVGLTYSTKKEQIENIVNDIREMLKNHSGIHQDRIMIYFTDYNSSSLDIFCYFFTNTIVWDEYLAIKENVNLKIMEIVERHGSSFAFPSRSLYIENKNELEENKIKEMI